MAAYNKFNLPCSSLPLKTSQLLQRTQAQYCNSGNSAAPFTAGFNLRPAHFHAQFRAGRRAPLKQFLRIPKENCRGNIKHKIVVQDVRVLLFRGGRPLSTFGSPDSAAVLSLTFVLRSPAHLPSSPRDPGASRATTCVAFGSFVEIGDDRICHYRERRRSV